MSKSKVKKIRPLDGFTNVSDAGVVSRGAAVETNLTGNANFPNPPVDLAALKAGIEKLSALMAESLDGSKKVVAEKNKQREAVIKMLRALGGYGPSTMHDRLFEISNLQTSSMDHIQF